MLLGAKRQWNTAVMYLWQCVFVQWKMRGFLKSREGIFQLALNTTTIGREGCDLFLSVCILLKVCLDIFSAFFLNLKTVGAKWHGCICSHQHGAHFDLSAWIIVWNFLLPGYMKRLQHCIDTDILWTSYSVIANGRAVSHLKLSFLESMQCWVCL